MLDCCEYDYARLSSFFGVALPAQNLPISVTIAPGLGGASNNGAKQITAFVGVNTSYTEPGLIEPLVVAELAEIFMAAQNNGWFAGWSNGEALSRVSGQVLYPENAWGFATGSSWFNPGSVGNLPDWVDNVEQTDQDYVSIGCGSLFLNYLAYQLNVTWPAICKAGAPSTHTLAETAGIVGPPAATRLHSLLQTNFPSGNLHSAATPFDQRLDDVFPLGQMPRNCPRSTCATTRPTTPTTTAVRCPTVPTSSLGTPQSRTLRDGLSTPAVDLECRRERCGCLVGQTNYLYLRVWNGGMAVSPERLCDSLLCTPNDPGDAIDVDPHRDQLFPSVPTGSQVEVTSIGIPWPADDPSAGPLLLVATVGCNYQPAPNPALLNSFPTFQDYENFISNNPNVTWRNFNVVQVHMGHKRDPVPLPFHLTGAWMEDVVFEFKTIAALPKGSTLALQLPDWIGNLLKPANRTSPFIATTRPT